MDAAGPDGPWSPRGNRANDVQALWFRQLKAGVALAEMVEDRTGRVIWEKIAIAVRANFNKFFVDSSNGLIADHLNVDNSQDHQFRPGQLLAFDLISDERRKNDVFRSITENLVYQHGVASLSQNDANFHPYHHYRPYYVQDASYHNGIVWTWLAGPWIDAAIQYGLPDLAYRVTDDMVHQILDRGAVGTLSELLDAAPRRAEDEPRLSGTVSQAWSLAEFIRVFHQDYLGVSLDALKRTIELSPNLPSTMERAQFTIPIGSISLEATYESSDDDMEVTLKSPASAETLSVGIRWRAGNAVARLCSLVLAPGKEITLSIRGTDVTKEFDGKHEDVRSHQTHAPDRSGYRNLMLATPIVRADLKSLRPPTHRLLKNSEIKRKNPGAALVCDASDPVGDDRGTGAFLYPLTSHIRPGSFDITRFTLRADERNAYFGLQFRSLSNPGWHPEYGFQLTYAAIAIDKDGKPGSGGMKVGMNSNYVLDRSSGYEVMVYVGGGLRVVDARHNILAEYSPGEADEKDPLGDAQNSLIEFSIPTDLIGAPESTWRFTVLVGCQDDHGGAGIGEFRTVGPSAKEWSGGGKKKSSDPNVYDTLIPFNH